MDRKQVTTRISAALLKRVKIKAIEEGRTVTEIIKEKLEEWVEDDPKEKRKRPG